MRRSTGTIEMNNQIERKIQLPLQTLSLNLSELSQFFQSFS